MTSAPPGAPLSRRGSGFFLRHVIPEVYSMTAVLGGKGRAIGSKRFWTKSAHCLPSRNLRPPLPPSPIYYARTSAQNSLRDERGRRVGLGKATSFDWLDRIRAQTRIARCLAWGVARRCTRSRPLLVRTPRYERAQYLHTGAGQVILSPLYCVLLFLSTSADIS